MATPEQVEAVARAIGLVEEEGKDYPSDMWLVDEFTDHATAAIAAYEATRPVVSDGELVWNDLERAYWDAYNLTTGRIMQERTMPATKEDLHHERLQSNAAGIRAVRARLEGLTDV